MTTQTNAPSMPGLAEGSISQYRILKQGTAARSVVHATATLTDVPVGVSQQGGSTGDMITVRMFSAGTCKVTASIAIVKGDKLYLDAAGKVTNVLGTGRMVGIAMEAATADGVVFEMLPGGEAGEGGFDLTDLQALTATPALTVSTGGSATTTLAAATNTDALTDNGGGTADGTVSTMPDIAIATGGGNTYSDSAVNTAVNTLAGFIRNNVKELTTELALQRTLNTNLINAITSLGTEYNKLRSDFADLRAKGVTAGLWKT